MPALLPIAVFAGWLLGLWKTREELFLVVASFFLLASAFPRFDAPHLRYISPLFYVLATALYHRTLARKLSSKVASVFWLLPAALFFWAGLSTSIQGHVVHTHVGQVRAGPEEAILFRKVSNRIQPGDSLFVFPYLPIVYFLTGGKNPTSSSWLQPGMMTEADEATVLGELRTRPPKWIFYTDAGTKWYLRIWPSSDPKRLRMPSVEQFIHSNYRPIETLKVSNREFFILGLTQSKQ